jgi:hypothetical protein
MPRAAGPLTALLMLTACGAPAADRSAPDSSPSSDSDAVRTDHSDSLRLSLVVPAEVALAAAVPVRFTVENVSGRQLELYLRGRTIAFDIVVTGPAGDTVWRRLEDEVIPAILRLEPLGPGEALELSDSWDQRDNAGRPVSAGDYRVRGELLTEGPPLRTAGAALRIVR